MATNHLVGFGITLHNIPKDWLLEFFGGVAAGIPEASIAGAVTLAIGLNSEFS
jgi:ZIP family zinc transporter